MTESLAGPPLGAVCLTHSRMSRCLLEAGGCCCSPSCLRSFRAPCSVMIYVFIFGGQVRWTRRACWRTSTPLGFTPEAVFPLYLPLTYLTPLFFCFHSPCVLCNRCHDLYSKGHSTPQCVCVCMSLPACDLPVHAHEQFSKDLMCTSPSERSAVGVLR